MIPGNLPDSRRQRCAFCLRSHLARDVFVSPAFVIFPICKDCFTRARSLASLPERSAQIGLLAGLLDAGRPEDYRRMAEICIASSQADRAVFAARMAIRGSRAEGDIGGEALALALLTNYELASRAETERRQLLKVVLDARRTISEMRSSIAATAPRRVLEEAAERLSAVINEKSDPVRRISLGHAWAQLGRISEAEEMWRLALVTLSQENSGSSHFRCGLIAFLLGDEESARRNWVHGLSRRLDSGDAAKAARDSVDVERWLACEELPLRGAELILRGILWSDWFHRDLGAAKKYFELALNDPGNALAHVVRPQLKRLAKRNSRAGLDRLRRMMGLKPLNGFLSRCAGCGSTNDLVFKNRFHWLSRLSLCAGCIRSVDRRTWSGDRWFRSLRQLPSDVFRD